MKEEQQLHDICDRIWVLTTRTREVIERLEENNPVRAYTVARELENDLGKILTELREKALREEGQHIVVNETYMGVKHEFKA